MKLFDFLNKKYRKLLIKKTFMKDQTILYAEHKNEFLYFLQEGVAEANIMDERGNISTIHLYRKGDFFGEFEPFYNGGRPVEIKAFTECSVYMLPHSLFLKWLEEDFIATKFFIGELSKKLILNANLIDKMSHMTIRERMLKTIAIHQSENTLDYLTKNQLLKEVNAPVRSLNREFKYLQDEHIIKYENKKIRIIDKTTVMSNLPEY